MIIPFQYSTTEWHVAIFLTIYVLVDFAVRFHSAYIAVKNKQRIIDYYSGWMSVKLYKEWFMFVRCNRLTAYVIMLVFLFHMRYYLIFIVLASKFLLEIVYHLLLKHAFKKLL